jgi:hypothetical protein
MCKKHSIPGVEVTATNWALPKLFF